MTYAIIDFGIKNEDFCRNMKKQKFNFQISLYEDRQCDSMKTKQKSPRQLEKIAPTKRNVYFFEVKARLFHTKHRKLKIMYFVILVDYSIEISGHFVSCHLFVIFSPIGKKSLHSGHTAERLTVLTSAATHRSDRRWQH